MKLRPINKRGFTLIELLVVLAIMGIVTTAIFSFLLFNVRNFNRAEDQLEVQYHAQMAMNKVIERAVGCKKISHIYLTKDAPIHDINRLSETNKNAVYTVTFEYVDGTRYTFSHHDKKLYEGNNESASTLSSNFIEELYITPIPSSTSYASTKGIEIEIKSTLNQSEVVVKNVVYFRNAE